MAVKAFARPTTSRATTTTTKHRGTTQRSRSRVPRGPHHPSKPHMQPCFLENADGAGSDPLSGANSAADGRGSGTEIGQSAGQDKAGESNDVSRGPLIYLPPQYPRQPGFASRCAAQRRPCFLLKPNRLSSQTNDGGGAAHPGRADRQSSIGSTTTTSSSGGVGGGGGGDGDGSLFLPRVCAAQESSQATGHYTKARCA